MKADEWVTRLIDDKWVVNLSCPNNKMLMKVQVSFNWDTEPYLRMSYATMKVDQARLIITSLSFLFISHISSSNDIWVRNLVLRARSANSGQPGVPITTCMTNRTTGMRLMVLSSIIAWIFPAFFHILCHACFLFHRFICLAVATKCNTVVKCLRVCERCGSQGSWLGGVLSGSYIQILSPELEKPHERVRYGLWKP